MDFVVTWVDENDPVWQKERQSYWNNHYGDNSVCRFRDWNLLRFWFRGVEKYAPWVRKIHFVTYGHYPQWLNVNHPKLSIVKHSDYIPSEFLPTFSSHPIELNLHRINALSEEFVFFNDDFYLLDSVVPEDFFVESLPCDSCNMTFNIPLSDMGIMGCIEQNNLMAINRHFRKSDLLRRHWRWFFNWHYGLYRNVYALYALPAPVFSGFYWTHSAQSFLKSSFFDVWEKEGDFLRSTCMHRFRDAADVNQYLIRYWQMLSGHFCQRNMLNKRQLIDVSEKTISTIETLLYTREKSIVCINDSVKVGNSFFPLQVRLHQAFQKAFPRPSFFENDDI